MDSEDDFNSSMSGEDFEDQDSDLEIEDGRSPFCQMADFFTDKRS
jgi:hypothetical protein